MGKGWGEEGSARRLKVCLIIQSFTLSIKYPRFCRSGQDPGLNETRLLPPGAPGSVKEAASVRNRVRRCGAQGCLETFSSPLSHSPSLPACCIQGVMLRTQGGLEEWSRTRLGTQDSPMGRSRMQMLQADVSSR